MFGKRYVGKKKKSYNFRKVNTGKALRDSPAKTKSPRVIHQWIRCLTGESDRLTSDSFILCLLYVTSEKIHDIFLTPCNVFAGCLKVSACLIFRYTDRERDRDTDKDTERDTDNFNVE
jgi:hypothetical protein